MFATATATALSPSVDATRSPALSFASSTRSAGKVKQDGNISSVFASLSGEAASLLPQRFVDLKREIVNPDDKVLQEKLVASWARLLKALEAESSEIAERGPDIVPQVDFATLSTLSEAQVNELKKRGCFVIRGVIPEDEVVGYNDATTKYCKQDNSDVVKGFPEDDKQVFEVYWSPAQLKARSHPNLLRAQTFAAQLWHASSDDTPIDLSYPLTYADRLRQRHPGDSKFALGPHMDAGSLERWEDPTYRSAYKAILEGDWEHYDAFDCSQRADAISDLYNGAGACGVWRAWQGWLAMSHTAPNEGTLLTYPNIVLSTSAVILRPFFQLNVTSANPSHAEIFDPANWSLDLSSSAFPNSAEGRAQEMSLVTHPHMNLGKGMVSVPKVAPGDVVFWHGDGTHAVSPLHIGKTDSCVMYIPSVPLNPVAAAYVARQRSAFLRGSPPEDFPGSGGAGEKEFVGRGLESDISKEGRAAMGFDVEAGLELDKAGLSKGQKTARQAWKEALEFETLEV